MSAGVRGNWWAVGLRGAAALLFAITILSLPPHAVAPLALLFTAYVAADGALAILVAHSGDCDRPFQPKVITDSGDRDHVLTRPTESA
jgi:uncharacterized membrane protein HdeD (DUF308 family)